MVVGCFHGFLHYLPATDKGFTKQTWLKDKAGNEIHTGQYWGTKERKWMKAEIVPGAPDNILGIYPDLKDWDNDGDLDLIFAGRRGCIGLRINEGSATDPQFSETAQFVQANGKVIQLAGHVSTDFVDLDADGLPDLVCVQNGGEITWYKNHGDKTAPKFNEATNVKNSGEDFPKSYPRISAADMNGDGKPDLVVSAKSSSGSPVVWVYYQE